MDKATRRLKNESECFGCGACIAICPPNAITKRKTALGSWVPEINTDQCVDCGLCKKVCKGSVQQNNFNKKAYIAYNKNQDMRKKSASGGAFSALATYVLDCGGSVFGAEMYFENGKAVVEHNKITQIKELHRLLGSKYVQSDTIKAYEQVRKELQSGNLVLFSGCSCQIVGLKNYLCRVDTTNLYTIDLICHGVPSIDLLNSYIMFLEKKHNGVIKSLSFRTKESGKITYKITAQIDEKFAGGVTLQTIFRVDIVIEGKGKIMREIKIPINKSGYYVAFMSQQSYRSSCYQCPYASLDKPADITVGDYFEVKKDYPNLFVGDNAMMDNGGVSCVITHTAKGQELLDKAVEYLYLKEVSVQKVQKSHLNLQRPSIASFERKILINGYERHGYGFVDKYYNLREFVICIPKKLKKLIKK